MSEEPMDWIVVDPDRPIRPLTTAQGDRAGGVLLGIGVVDGWSRATELALCVADAAATGRPLTDPLVLDLLRRNVAELRSTQGATGVDLNDPDALLASTAVVTLAHLHDSAEDRADAARAVAATMGAATIVDDTVLRWIELVAETVRTGVVSRAAADPAVGTVAGMVAAVVDAAIASVAEAEVADGTGAGAFDPRASAVASAARGALLGARFGWRAVPDELASHAAGWPGTDARALVGLAIHAARLRQRSVEVARDPADGSGGDVPVEQWNASTENTGAGTPSTTPEPRDDAPRWRRSWVALTSGDAQSSGDA